MKLRTLERFEDEISRETAWRRKELTTLRHQATASREHARPMIIRAGTALLYAHWEGFVKTTSQLYVEYVRQKKLKYAQLSTPMLGLALKSRMDGLVEAKAAAVHVEFARVVREDLEDRAPLRPNLVDTGSNLSSKRFRDIVTRLGLSYNPYELKQHLIDVRLVDARNGIAHGQALLIGQTEFLDLHERVAAMLWEFRDDILEAARSSTYRLP